MNTLLQHCPNIYKSQFLHTLVTKIKKIVVDKSLCLKNVINSLDKDLSHYYTPANSFYLPEYELDNTIKSYQNYIDMNPTDAYAHYKLALALDAQKSKEAKKYFIKAIRLNTDLSAVDNNIYNMLMKSREFYNAMRYYINKFNFITCDSNLYYSLGSIFYTMKDIESSIKCYLITTKLNIYDFKAYYYLGVLYGTKGALKKSIQYLLKAVKLKPDYADAYFMLGHKYFIQQDFIKAAQMYLKSKDLDPRFFRPHMSLGNIYQNVS